MKRDGTGRDGKGKSGISVGVRCDAMGVGNGNGEREREKEKEERWLADGWKQTLIIQHDSQNRDLISLTDPIHAPRHAEQERAVADDLTHELLLAHGVGRELDAQRAAARPAEPAAAAVEPAAGQRGLDLVGDKDGVGDGFDGEDGVVGHGVADLGDEVGDVVVAVVAGLCEIADGGESLLVSLCEGGPSVVVSGEGFG